MGINAAEELARLLIHLRDAVFALNAQRRDPWTKFPSPYQFVVQNIHSDGEQLTVPEFASAGCYVTFPPPYTLATMQSFLEEQVQTFARESRQIERPNLIWSGFLTEPVQSDSLELVQALQQSVHRVGLTPIEIMPSTGTSDLRHFAQAGVPCLLYGPGKGFNPHRPNEHYYLEELPKMVLCYLDLISNWCA